MNPRKTAGIKHGGDLVAFSKRYGKSEEEVLDFSSNINPFGPPASVLRLYPQIASDLSAYPDPHASDFTETVAGIFSLSPENVITGNGSLALMDLALRALSPARALIVEPCFTEYRRLLEMTGAQVQSIALTPENDFKFPLEKILECLPQIDLLFLGHPNNPTGTALLPEEMQRLLKEASRLKVYVLLDEAFADWSPEISFSSHAGRNDFLIVIRSLTKFFSLAGIRSGFALGPELLIRPMKRIQGPWSCNRIAQKLSKAALLDLEFIFETKRWFESEKAWFQNALEGLGLFKVFPGRANFFLLRNLFPAPGLEDFLGERGFYVRFLEDFRGLDGPYLRLALKSREENKALVDAFLDWKENRILHDRARLFA